MQIQAVFFLKTLVSTYKTTMFDVPKDYYKKRTVCNKYIIEYTNPDT